MLKWSFENAIATRLRENDPSALEPVWVDIYLEPTTSTERVEIIIANTTEQNDLGVTRSANDSEEWYLDRHSDLFSNYSSIGRRRHYGVGF